MADEIEDFFVVLRHKSGNASKQNVISTYYPSEGRAREAASRLAVEHQSRFYVMKPLAFVEPMPPDPPVRWSDDA